MTIFDKFWSAAATYESDDALIHQFFHSCKFELPLAGAAPVAGRLPNENEIDLVAEEIMADLDALFRFEKYRTITTTERNNIQIEVIAVIQNCTEATFQRVINGLHIDTKQSHMANIIFSI